MQMLAERFREFGTTIFTEMTLLANKHGAVNLAQGFPDFDGPDFVKRAAVEAINAGHNQYARMFGIPALNQALAAKWQRETGSAIDPDTQVCVTSGCTEAIAAAMLGLVNPGDEVILFEPYYDSYRASVAMAGGVAKFVTLRAPKSESEQFWFDEHELERAFSNKTRLVFVNTPHNPTGKVFSRPELELIARLCQKHGAIALTDEVYEHLTFDPASPHIRLATLEGMAERTLTLSSLGKSFSLTGFKVGWAIGPAELVKAVRSAHQFLTFATATAMQHGAVAALTHPDSPGYVRGLVEQFARGRDTLSAGLREIGFKVYQPAGAYFVMVDWTDARVPGLGRLGERFADDAAFCKYITEHAKVAAIPPSVFYQNKQHGRALARFAFCKKAETLAEGVSRLTRFARGANSAG